MSAMTTADVAFSDYGAILQRRWKLVALGLAAGVFLAVAGLVFIPKTYSSSAAVMVQSTGEDGAVQGGRTSSSLNLDTEAQVVKSTVVSQLALDDLENPGEDDARALAKHVLVTVPPNTSVLNIMFSASSPEGARDGATAFADAYLANRKAVADRRIKSQADSVEAQVKALGLQVKALDKEVSGLPQGSSERADAAARRAALVSQAASLNSTLVGLQSSEILPGEIITDAQLPTRPSSPNDKILLVSGLMGGLLLGLLLAYVVDRLDRRVRDRRDLERLGLDALVAGVTVEPALVASKGSSSEAMRQLRNGLLARLPGGRSSVIVAGASGGVGGSLVALHLSETLARSGLNVLLVSANSSHCMVAEAFGTGDRPGLSDLIRGLARIDQTIGDAPDTPNLRVVHSGSDGSLHSELLLGRQVQRVLESLTPFTDVMVIDVAPTSENADAQSLASLGSGVLLVAEALHTQRDEVAEAIDQFRHVAAVIFGAVVVTVARPRKGTRPNGDGVNSLPFVDRDAPVPDDVPEPSESPKHVESSSSDGRENVHSASPPTVR